MPAENHMKVPTAFVTQERVHTTNNPTTVFFLQYNLLTAALIHALDRVTRFL